MWSVISEPITYLLSDIEEILLSSAQTFGQSVSPCAYKKKEERNVIFSHNIKMLHTDVEMHYIIL